MSNKIDDIEEWLLSINPNEGIGKAFTDYYNSETKKNKILNISVAKKMFSTAEKLKEYFSRTPGNIIYKFDVEPFNSTRSIGVISIVFDTMFFLDSADFKNLVQDSSYVEFIIDGVDPRIDIGFRNITNELK